MLTRQELLDRGFIILDADGPVVIEYCIRHYNSPPLHVFADDELREMRQRLVSILSRRI